MFNVEKKWPVLKTSFSSRNDIKMIKLEMPRMGSEQAILKIDANKHCVQSKLATILNVHERDNVAKRKLIQIKGNLEKTIHNKPAQQQVRDLMETEIKTIFMNCLLQQKESLREIPEEDEKEEKIKTRQIGDNTQNVGRDFQDGMGKNKQIRQICCKNHNGNKNDDLTIQSCLNTDWKSYKNNQNGYKNFKSIKCDRRIAQNEHQKDDKNFQNKTKLDTHCNNKTNQNCFKSIQNEGIIDKNHKNCSRICQNGVEIIRNIDKLLQNVKISKRIEKFRKKNQHKVIQNDNDLDKLNKNEIRIAK